jgi:hypothetical protein
VVQVLGWGKWSGFWGRVSGPGCCGVSGPGCLWWGKWSRVLGCSKWSMVLGEVNGPGGIKWSGVLG